MPHHGMSASQFEKDRHQYGRMRNLTELRVPHVPLSREEADKRYAKMSNPRNQDASATYNYHQPSSWTSEKLKQKAASRSDLPKMINTWSSLNMRPDGLFAKQTSGENAAKMSKINYLASRENSKSGKSCIMPVNDLYVISEGGAVKGIQMEQRHIMQYFDDRGSTQLTSDSGSEFICEPTTKSYFSINSNAVVKYFNNGEWTTLSDYDGIEKERLENPVFFGMMPQWKKYRERYEKQSRPSMKNAMLVSLFKKGLCLYQQRTVFDLNMKNENNFVSYDFKLGAYTRNATLTTACIQANESMPNGGTITIGGNDRIPQNMDLRTGRTIWATDFKKSRLDWAKPKDAAGAKNLSVIQLKKDNFDDPSKINNFYSVESYGVVRKYDMRVNNQLPVFQTTMHMMGKSKDKFESFLCLDLNKHLIGLGGNQGSTLLLDNRMLPSFSTEKGEWGSDSKCVVRTLAKAEAAINSIAFPEHNPIISGNESQKFYHADKEIIATASNDGCVRLYDLRDQDKRLPSFQMFLKNKLNKIIIPSNIYCGKEKEILALANREKQAMKRAATESTADLLIRMQKLKK